MAIRRRFEKRIYIPLPERETRSAIVKIHLSDVRNNLSERDFNTSGQKTEGLSGADIKSLVNKADLETLRHCRQAEQFIPVGKYLVPCKKHPNCPYCPQALSSDPPNKKYDCTDCGAQRMKMTDMLPDKLMSPDISMEDFLTVLRHSHASVSGDNVVKYTNWTKEFGEDGA